jgi:transcriptional regulator with XRE-family HTH domain
MEDHKKKIGENLRDLRLEKNYTQEYLGEVLGKSDYTSYQRLEHGKSELKIQDAYKLAKFYKLPLEYIVEPELRKENTIANEKLIHTASKKNIVQMTVNLDGTDQLLEDQYKLLQGVNQLIADKES